jgi:hypothetical protein
MNKNTLSVNARISSTYNYLLVLHFSSLQYQLIWASRYSGILIKGSTIEQSLNFENLVLMLIR